MHLSTIDKLVDNSLASRKSLDRRGLELDNGFEGGAPSIEAKIVIGKVRHCPWLRFLLVA